MKAIVIIMLAAAQWPGDQEIPAVAYPVLPRSAPTPDAFVPRGWKLETMATGDLNADKLPDTAMVLHMDDSKNRIAPSWDQDRRYDTNPRMLVIAFRKAGGGYVLAATEHKLIPRLENPNQDDPFDELKIVNGTVRVRMHLFMSAGGWWAGGSAYTFRWQNGAFRLIGFDRDGVQRNTGETEEVSINYLTGAKLLKSGSIESDQQKSRTVKIARKPLLTLAEVGDGLMFDPDER